MKLKMVNVAIVLLGQNLNPIQFSHESLRSARIVKRSWELVQPPVALPGLSLLRFNNKLSILVDPTRAQILLDRPLRDLSKAPLAEVAEGISRRLSNSLLTAVGFNITAIIELENATTFLYKKFLRDDSFMAGDLEDIGLNFSHSRMDAILNLMVEANKAGAKYTE